MVSIARTAVIIAAALLLAGGAASAQDPSAPAPTEVVRDLQRALLDSMKAGEQLDFPQRVERLRPVIERSHQFDEITRFMLGRHARELDDEQFAAIVEALRRLSVAEYASRFNRYNGETLEVLSSSSVSEDRVLVVTELVKSSGEAVRLEYMLQERDGRWGVINVVADGVSDLALKRAEYSTVLRQDGYTALLERLHSQAAEIRSR